jgi:PAS domain S-box-containing protein
VLDKEQLKSQVFKFTLISALTIIYFISGKISLNFAYLHQSASPFWFPTGISLTAFIIWGYKIWPSIFIGAFFVNITTAGSVATSLGIALGNTLEGAAALYLVHKFIEDKNIFEKPLNIFKYVLLVGLLSTIISATFGVSSLYLGNLIEKDNYFPVLTTWWLGDMGGALIIAPVLLLWIVNYKIDLKPRKISEASIIFSLLIITSVLIFIDQVSIKLPSIIDSYPFGFLTFPLFILITFRFSLRETASAIFIFTLIALVGTINGSQRLAQNDPNLSLLNLQIFTGLIFLVIMSISAAITKQRKLEETYRESEERYRMLAETAPDAIITINEESKILFCNPSTKKIFGYSPDELIGKDLTTLMPDHLKNVHKKELNRYIKTGKPNIPWSSVELFGLHKNGNDIPLEISFSKYHKNDSLIFTGIIRDVTDRKNAQIQMENSLNEKEVLLREVHHRVKNNLQIVSSLLSLQSEHLSENNFREFFIKSQNRVKSIAIVHEMLYKSENISKINFKNYIDKLSGYITESYYAENIKINVLAENIYFDTDVTINLGLIVNEIIANSVKHAFNGIKEGKIIIELNKNNSIYSLSVRDNGKGLPDSFDLNETRTLGMHLISSLVTQIDGNMEIKNNIGTEYLITFEVK